MGTLLQSVFEEGNKEYLTEKQLIEDGPLLVDVDLRYNSDIKSRQHTKEHIIDLVYLYLAKLTDIYFIDDKTEIKCYVLEKPNVNILENKTKDGIHLIFGIKNAQSRSIIIKKNDH